MNQDNQQNKHGKHPVTMLAQAAVIAAVYALLTLSTSFMSFGILQLRLSEALTALPALFPSAIPGVFIGCLLANVLNPSPLGWIDIVFGSLTTLVSAWLTWRLAAPWRRKLIDEARARVASAWTASAPMRQKPAGARDLVVPLLPPVVLNALVVGTYLPFLTMTEVVTFPAVAGSWGLIALTEGIVVYAIGLPLVMALRRTPAGNKSLQSFDDAKKD